jgi:hypothetical protein
MSDHPLKNTKKTLGARPKPRSQSWQAEQRRIKEEANRKRSEAAKERDRTKAGTFKLVVEQIVPPLDKEHKERKANAAASKTNPGAVARGNLFRWMNTLFIYLTKVETTPYSPPL